MENKICSICKTEKSFDSFLWKNKSKNLKHSVCSECYKKVRKKSYDANSQYYKDKSKKRRKEHASQYEEYKKSLSCKVCGESETVCLDFHHLYANEKDFNIAARKHSTTKFEKIVREIEKCVVLCANCHRKVHAGIIRLDGVIG